MTPHRDPEPPTCASCGKPWREPHRGWLPGFDAPVCMACFCEPDTHEQIDALAHERTRR